MNIIDSNTGRKALTLAEAELLLGKAQAAYEEAADKARTARSIETSAGNALNEAQRDFDAAVSRIKADAPPGSDWKRIETRRSVA